MRKPRGILNGCPICHGEVRGPLHTDKEVRQLGLALEWRDLGVCQNCYAVLRAYRAVLTDEGHAALVRGLR
jgi:hypothetical protein